MTIDTTIATLNAPDLTTATDTAGPGGNTSDNLTKDNTPDFSINVSGATAGDTVELLNNGSPFGAPVTHVLTQGEITAGAITLTAGTLGDGLHNISVKLSDAAGNTTTLAALPVTIDTTIATLATPICSLALTLGGNTSDNLTNVTTPGRFNDQADAQLRRQATRPSCSTTDRRSGAPVTHVPTQGELTAGSTTLTAGTLGDGLHGISVKLSDARVTPRRTAAVTRGDRRHDRDAERTPTCTNGRRTRRALAATPATAVTNGTTATERSRIKRERGARPAYTVELLDDGPSFGAPVTHVLTQGEIDRRLDHADGGHAGRRAAQHLGQAERCGG